MNKIKKEIIRLLYHSSKGMRVKDLIIRVQELRKLGSLEVRSKAYHILVMNLNKLKDKGFIKKIKYNGTDINFNKDGETFWLMTKYAREKQTKFFKSEGII